jgi:hypothetical protein
MGFEICKKPVEYMSNLPQVDTLLAENVLRPLASALLASSRASLSPFSTTSQHHVPPLPSLAVKYTSAAGDEAAHATDVPRKLSGAILSPVFDYVDPVGAHISGNLEWTYTNLQLANSQFPRCHIAEPSNTF